MMGAGDVGPPLRCSKSVRCGLAGGRRPPRRALSPVITTERRTQALPFVGVDRRTTTMGLHSEVDKLAA
jgi:hypothetical protein